MQETQLNPYVPPHSEPQRAAEPTNWRSSTGLSIVVAAVSWWTVLVAVVHKPIDELSLDQVLVLLVVGPALGGSLGVIKRSCLLPGTVIGATFIGMFFAICMDFGIENLHKLEVSRKAIEDLKFISVVLFFWGIVFGASVLLVRIVISFIARRVRRLVTPHEKIKG